MSTAGVFLGLLVLRMPFGIIMTGVGIIALAGIVVNNAIVLLDYVGILRTYWGGEQAAMWGPMATAVIIGILFATFLTLILVPVLYSVVDDLSDFFKRKFTHGGETWVVDTEVPDQPGRVGTGGTEPSLEPIEVTPA